MKRIIEMRLCVLMKSSVCGINEIKCLWCSYFDMDDEYGELSKFIGKGSMELGK